MPLYPYKDGGKNSPGESRGHTKPSKIAWPVEDKASTQDRAVPGKLEIVAREIRLVAIIPIQGRRENSPGESRGPKPLNIEEEAPYPGTGQMPGFTQNGSDAQIFDCAPRRGPAPARPGPAANPTRQRAARKALVVEGRGSLAPRYLCVAPAAGRLGVGADRAPARRGWPAAKTSPCFLPNGGA